MDLSIGRLHQSSKKIKGPELRKWTGRSRCERFYRKRRTEERGVRIFFFMKAREYRGNDGEG